MEATDFSPWGFTTIEPHARALRCAGLYDGFDAVYLSHEVGMRKPGPAIYEYVLGGLGVAPGEAVFIDDVPANVEAARALGICGVAYATPDQLAADLRRLIPGLTKTGGQRRAQ